MGPASWLSQADHIEMGGASEIFKMLSSSIN